MTSAVIHNCHIRLRAATAALRTARAADRPQEERAAEREHDTARRLLAAAVRGHATPLTVRKFLVVC